jgi:hypothetical protein
MPPPTRTLETPLPEILAAAGAKIILKPPTRTLETPLPEILAQARLAETMPDHPDAEVWHMDTLETVVPRLARWGGISPTTKWVLSGAAVVVGLALLVLFLGPSSQPLPAEREDWPSSSRPVAALERKPASAPAPAPAPVVEKKAAPVAAAPKRAPESLLTPLVAPAPKHHTSARRPAKSEDVFGSWR